MAKSKVVSLVPAKADVHDEDVVRICEDLLAKAKSGELRSVAVAGECSDGAPVFGLATDGSVSHFTLLGLLTTLTSVLVKSAMESV